MSEKRIPVTSPVPGQVLEIYVKLGDKVEKGQPIFSILSMKTEFKITAPESGEIDEIIVKEETEVDAEEVLAYIKLK